MATPFSFTLDQQQYEALIALARAGTFKPNGMPDQPKALSLDTFLRSIEEKNNIVRDIVWIQWQELDTPLPRHDFPEVWPPELRAYVETVTRLVSRADIDEVLKVKARKPTSILFTRDPGAVYGWTEIDKFT